MDYVKLELDASQKGWRCSGCGIQIDSIGRPVMGELPWLVITRRNNWIDSKPNWKFCPSCGKPIEGGETHE